MPLRMFSEVLGPKRGRRASRPSSAAASSSGSESMSSTSWIWRILATPSPWMASISTSPGGICSRSSSSMLARPVVTISATICSVAGPTPLVAARLPSSIPSRRSAGKPPTARAAVRKARMRNGFSPLSSRNAAICSSTWATAFLSMKLRTASVMAGWPKARSRVRGHASPARAAPRRRPARTVPPPPRPRGPGRRVASRRVARGPEAWGRSSRRR